jgi:hypothetical protein
MEALKRYCLTAGWEVHETQCGAGHGMIAFRVPVMAPLVSFSDPPTASVPLGNTPHRPRDAALQVKFNLSAST